MIFLRSVRENGLKPVIRLKECVRLLAQLITLTESQALLVTTICQKIATFLALITMALRVSLSIIRTSAFLRMM